MNVTTAAAATAPTKTTKARTVALDVFLARYTNREDPFKYEWNNGVVEKKARTMNREQFLIVQKLLRLFASTNAYTNMGELLLEVDMFLPQQRRTRRADMAYLSGAQMRASRDGAATVCSFVVEIISKNDQIYELEDKKIEYFANGVEVLWIIFPKAKKVEVYRSLKAVQICLEGDICSAAPVLADFEIAAGEIFK